jgi:hypothetical protein
MKKTACFISVLGGASWRVEDDEFLIEKVEKGELGGFSAENEHKEEFKRPKRIKENIFCHVHMHGFTLEAQQRYEDGMINSIIGVVNGK